MKKYLLSLILFSYAWISHAAVYHVEAGGNSSVTPYYSPQFFTIQVGDTVIWDFVLGTHNVTTTNAPVTIESPNVQSPGVFEYQFTVAGIYDYECSLFNHAATQFGTITVEEASTDNISDVYYEVDVNLFPNPTINFVHVDSKLPVQKISCYNLQGQLVCENYNLQSLSVASLPAGNYWIAVAFEKAIIRKQIVVKKI